MWLLAGLENLVAITQYRSAVLSSSRLLVETRAPKHPEFHCSGIQLRFRQAETRLGWNLRRRVYGHSKAGYFAIRYVRSPAAFLADSIFSPPLLPRTLTKLRMVCFCQPVASVISATVAPLARFIRAMTSAFLLVRDSVVLFCARASREALRGDFFDRVRSVRTGVAGGATSGDRRSTAFQILATAAFRSVNFLTGFKSPKCHTSEAVPGVDQAGRGPFRGEFAQLLCIGKRLRFVGTCCGAGERRDVVI
jgi:hypothetical protein